MDEETIRRLLADPQSFAESAFPILRELVRMANDERSVVVARELVIRVLALKAQLRDGYDDLLDSLVRQVGLYPYVDQMRPRSFADQVAIEAHRVPGIMEGRLFHSLQLEVFQGLVRNDNIVRSAPTSVGKSLVIEAVLATKHHKK